MKPFTEVCLRIGGDGMNPELCAGVNPKICTDILGITPDIQLTIGEPLSMTHDIGIKRRTSVWMYSTENRIKNDDPFDPIPHVNHIIQLFSGKRHLFDRIRNIGNVRISICVTWGVQHGSYTFDNQLIQTILDMGIDEVRHIFVSVDDEEENNATQTNV